MAQAGEVPEDITQSIPVPADKIGWVIGKEGSYIKQLEERSKAVVRISDSSSREYGREWKYVQLQGAPRAVDRAKKLLHIRLERLIQRLSIKEHTASLAAAQEHASAPVKEENLNVDTANKPAAVVTKDEQEGGTDQQESADDEAAHATG